MGTDISYSFAINSLGSIVLALACICLSWWALQQFRFELFLKNPKSPQGKVLQIILAVVLGYELTRFIMDYFNWSGMLKGMF